MKLFNVENVNPKMCRGFGVGRSAYAHVAIVVLFVCLTASSVNAQLVHPGGWHTQADLTIIRESVAAEREPWITGWLAARDEGPDANFRSNPPRVITNNGATHTAGFAAWVLTMKWVASGDKSFSDAAIGIIDNWVDTVEDFDVFAPTLTVSTGAGAMAQAAEILAHGFDGEAGWPAEDVAAAQAWFRDVVYEPQTNTGIASSANFGTSALGGNLSMAIFMDDQGRYNFQRQAFITGYNSDDGCNSLTDYIPFATGQAFETGRDQGHVQGGIAHLTEAALCLWHQGDQFVYLENNRLLAGVEYHARYNLGFDDLPYDPDVPNRCNIPFSFLNATEIGSEERGIFSPVYYMSAQLFTKAGLNHPNTRAVLISPGYSPEINNFAHPGLGMFTFVSIPDENSVRDIAVNIDVDNMRGDADAATPTLADFIDQNPGCLLDENAIFHNNVGTNNGSSFGSNFGAGVTIGGFTVTTTDSDLDGTGTNSGFNAGDAAHNDTNPITEGYAFRADNTNVFIDGLLANTNAGDTIVLSIWGIGDNINQQANFAVTYGSNTASEGNIQETRYNGEGEPRDSDVGSIPFVNFTFVADGVSDQISFDISNATGTSNAVINAFSLSVTQASNETLLGDVNLDGTVDFLDISPFITVLSGGYFQAEADCDQSGAIGFLDISPFIGILSGSGS